MSHPNVQVAFLFASSWNPSLAFSLHLPAPINGWPVPTTSSSQHHLWFSEVQKDGRPLTIWSSWSQVVVPWWESFYFWPRGCSNLHMMVWGPNDPQSSLPALLSGNRRSRHPASADVRQVRVQNCCSVSPQGPPPFRSMSRACAVAHQFLNSGRPPVTPRLTLASGTTKLRWKMPLSRHKRSETASFNGWTYFTTLSFKLLII